MVSKITEIKKKNQEYKGNSQLQKNNQKKEGKVKQNLASSQVSNKGLINIKGCTIELDLSQNNNLVREIKTGSHETQENVEILAQSYN